jgi:hypothetical protein
MKQLVANQRINESIFFRKTRRFIGWLKTPPLVSILREMKKVHSSIQQSSEEATACLYTESNEVQKSDVALVQSADRNSNNIGTCTVIM